MNLEQLKKANEIVKKIENCKANILKANYTQNENVVTRKTFLKVSGLDEEIEIPSNLFRVIGKLILSEHQQKLIELEKELESI